MAAQFSLTKVRCRRELRSCRTREEFLAGARLAADEDGGVGGGDGFDLCQDPAKGGALPDDAHYCGLIDPVSSLSGAGRLVGNIYPTSHLITISRGTFNKALGFAGLYESFLPPLIAIPVLIGLSAALLKKQEA